MWPLSDTPHSLLDVAAAAAADGAEVSWLLTQSLPLSRTSGTGPVVSAIEVTKGLVNGVADSSGRSVGRADAR